MQAMAERKGMRKLSGRVIADDAYLGGVTTSGKRGRGRQDSQAGLFMAAIQAETDASVRYIRFDLLQNLNANRIKNWATKALHKWTHLLTDEYSCLSLV